MAKKEVFNTIEEARAYLNDEYGGVIAPANR